MKGQKLISKDLQPLAVPLTSLKLADRNPRKGDVEAIKKSYERFGQRKPIVVARATSEIVAGNHQYLAARELGWKKIAVVWVDDDPETQAAYSIADNRIGQLGEWDVSALIEAFDMVGPGDLEAAGFAETDVLDFRALADEKEMLVAATTVSGTAHGRGLGEQKTATEVSTDDFLSHYASRATRAIILYYPTVEYDIMVTELDALAQRWGLSDNAAVVEKLVKEAM